jgi:hypothetical protein
MTYRITALTLVDITDTGVQRVSESNTKAYHQQQNLNVLLQTCGLRTQIFEPKFKIHYNADIKGRFSDFFGVDRTTVWEMNFQIETDMIWSDGEDHLAFLKQDVHGVAITSDLDNIVEFPVNIFDTRDNVNTYFQIS